jgi:hypothetical protein
MALISSSSLATNFFFLADFFMKVPEVCEIGLLTSWCCLQLDRSMNKRIQLRYICWISWYVISLVLLLNFQIYSRFPPLMFLPPAALRCPSLKMLPCKLIYIKVPLERNEILIIFSSLFSIKSPWKQFLLCLIRSSRFLQYRLYKIKLFNSSWVSVVYEVWLDKTLRFWSALPSNCKRL